MTDAAPASVTAAGTSPAEDRSSYLPTLDGWRAIAVIGVILFHIRGDVHARWAGTPIEYAVVSGRMGVDLFFAISGFLITSRLVVEAERSGRVRLGAFYIRRAFRILPPVFLYLALVGTLALYGVWRPSATEWLGALFFFRNYVHGNTLTEHLWSLSVEEHFYLVWPALFVAIRRIRGAALIVVALAVLVFVWRSLLVYGVLHPSIPGPREFRTDTHFDGLLWGAALAVAIRSPRARAWGTRILSWPVWVVAVGVFIYANSCDYHRSTTLLAVTTPIVIAATALHPTWFVSRWLERPGIRWVGRLSYSLYLFQQAFITAPIPVPHPDLFLLPAACFSYYVVERPMIDFGRDLLALRVHGARQVITRLAYVAALGTLVAYVGWRQIKPLRRTHVALYSDANFEGVRSEIALGTHDLAATGAVGDNVVSSLEVGADAHLRLCDARVDGAPGGECVDYDPGAKIPFVGGPFNDRASFAVVTPARR